MPNKSNNYLEFADKFYEDHLRLVNNHGLNRTFERFHLVDMFPSLKAMEKCDDSTKLAQIFREKNSSEFASIYIHFPFCVNNCSYCHLYKERSYLLKSLEEKYIDSLIKEIKLYTDILGKKITAKSIYFGGGTPSLMSLPSLKKLLKALREVFNIPDNIFISFEVFPDANAKKDELEEKLKILKNFGVKEIVLDLQSTNQKSLNDVGRGNSSFISWNDTIDLIKKVGIPNIKSSMIIGLPYDNIETFGKSVFDLINTKEVSTVSLFLLEFRKGLRVFNDLKNFRERFCSEEERDKMQILVRKILTDNGFQEGPLHFFKRRKESKDKIALVGTHQDHLLGFGPSAYGHVIIGDQAIKYYNSSDINKYVEKINKRELPISRWHTLNKEEQDISKFIDDIFSDGIVSKKTLLDEFSIDLDNKYGDLLRKFQNLGLLINDTEYITITEAGKLRAEELVWYLYDENYKEKQRSNIEDAETLMHNYVTVLPKSEELKLQEYLKS